MLVHLTLTWELGWAPWCSFGYRIVIEFYFSPIEWELRYYIGEVSQGRGKLSTQMACAPSDWEPLERASEQVQKQSLIQLSS